MKKLLYYQILIASLIYFSIKVGRMYFLSLGVEGLNVSLLWLRKPLDLYLMQVLADSNTNICCMSVSFRRTVSIKIGRGEIIRLEHIPHNIYPFPVTDSYRTPNWALLSFALYQAKSFGNSSLHSGCIHMHVGDSKIFVCAMSQVWTNFSLLAGSPHPQPPSPVPPRARRACQQASLTLASTSASN